MTGAESDALAARLGFGKNGNCCNCGGVFQCPYQHRLKPDYQIVIFPDAGTFHMTKKMRLIAQDKISKLNDKVAELVK